MDLTNETKINKKKKKRVRKNKKWIPYKELTPEERTLLRQERNRKHLREHLLRTRMAVNTASNSGDYSFLMNAPNVTNEDYEFIDIPARKVRKWDAMNNSDEDDEFIKSYEQEELEDGLEGNDEKVESDEENTEESLRSLVRRQGREIEDLERENRDLRNEMRELDLLMKQFAAKL